MSVIVAVRTAATAVWWSDTQADPDVYVALARGLADGAGFCQPGTTAPTAYRPPGYPLLLATLIRVPGFQHGLAIPVWNILFDLATIGFVWSWLRSTPAFPARAWIAALLLACDPLMVRYAAQPMTEACFTCWSTAGVLLLSNIASGPQASLQRMERSLWGIAGGLLGVAALCRPSIWPFVGLFSAITLARVAVTPRLRGHWQQRLIEWLTLIGVAGLMVSPWVLRNTFVFGTPVLTTTHGGYTLLLANNPVFYQEVARQPWGTVWSGDSLARWQTEMLARMDVELGDDANEVSKDHWQSREARRHVFDDPGGFVAGAWYRFRSFWSLAPRGGKAPLSLAVRWGVAAWYASLFAAAAAGLVILWRERTRGLWVLVLFVLSLQGVHLVYWTDTRMRMPIHSVLAILAATALSRGLSRWYRWWRQPSREVNPVRT